MNQPQPQSHWKGILKGWSGEKISGWLGAISLLVTVATKTKDFFVGKPKNEFEITLDKLSKEAEEKGATKKAAEIYEKELEITRELIKECNNENQQLDAILTLREITSEDRKINKKITCQEWIKNDEVKVEIHKIGEKRERCKNCEYCSIELEKSQERKYQTQTQISPQND